jgi:hypothetical protein
VAKVKTVDFQGRRRQVAYSVDADLARQLEAEADRRGIAAADLEHGLSVCLFDQAADEPGQRIAERLQGLSIRHREPHI